MIISATRKKESGMVEGDARMVKWTILDPCLVLSESDSKLYTNFDFVKEKNHRYFLKHVD